MEREELIQKLEFLAYQFGRFEQQYNLVQSLPSNKKVVYTEKNQNNIKKVTSRTSFVGYTILGVILMYFPAGFISLGVTMLKARGNIYAVTGPDIGSLLLSWVILTVLFAKYKSKKAAQKAYDKMARHNSAAEVHNDDVNRQIAIAEQNCVAIRKELSGMDLSWYPPDYSYSHAAKSFANYIKNFRADNLKEAINLFQEEQYRNTMTDLQRQQVSLQRQQLAAAWTQCILQAQTIGAINHQGEMTRNAINNQGAMTRDAINSAASSIKNIFS